eukprot:6017341-Amphidinium_carterae.1
MACREHSLHAIQTLPSLNNYTDSTKRVSILSSMLRLQTLPLPALLCVPRALHRIAFSVQDFLEGQRQSSTGVIFLCRGCYLSARVRRSASAQKTHGHAQPTICKDSRDPTGIFLRFWTR